MITHSDKTSAAAVTGSVFGGSVAEQYFSLVQWLRTIGDTASSAPKVFGVTGCGAGAGASTVAMNLAVVAAEVIARPVLLLDLSSSRPLLARKLALTGDLGLSAALGAVDNPAGCAKPTTVPNLSLLGDNQSATEIALDSGSVYKLLKSLEQDFAFIVVDLPPTDSTLCFATAGLMDGVLMVMESERTRGEAAARAKQTLQHANANLLGVILNKQRQDLPRWLTTRL